MNFYLRDRSWIASGGAKGGRGDHRPDPAPFPADDGTPTPPADDQHSRQWHAQNGRGGTGERDRGSTTAIGHRATGRGITAFPPSDAAGRGRDGRVKQRAAAGSPALWRTCQKADVQRDGGTRSPTGCRVYTSADALGVIANVTPVRPRIQYLCTLEFTRISC